MKAFKYGLIALIALAGCGSDEDDGVFLGADIKPRSGSSVVGMALFSKVESGVQVGVSLSNAPPGQLAVHIHENGDCGPEGGDATQAGDHWKASADEQHGMPGATPSHLGDLGNITIGADGKGTIMLVSDRWTIEAGKPGGVKGHAVVVHQKADDFGQPTGNAGGRIACGVIQ